MSEVKARLYWYLVERNEYINSEYLSYAYTNGIKRKGRISSRFKILLLNLKYRVLKYKPLVSGNTHLTKSTLKKSTSIATKSKTVEHKPEHQFLKRKEVQFLGKHLCSFDVVSFDVFDTLFFRPFSGARDLLALIGHKFNEPNFYHIRMEAEMEARRKQRLIGYAPEITLEQIYDEIKKKTGIDKYEGMAEEIRIELEFCTPNPYVKHLFNILKAKQKEIILVSDMFMPKVVIKQMVEKCGYTGYGKLYVSSEYGYGKGHGRLYKKVKKDYPKMKIAHIGDNYHSDVSKARDAGLTAFHYRNVNNSVGNQFRPKDLTSFQGCGYKGIVNYTLHNGMANMTPAYEYGFVAGGFYILGFMNFINKYCKENNVEKILFLARDGAIYKRVFDELFDIENEYVYYSRICNTKNISSKNKDYFLQEAIIDKIHQPKKISLKTMLKTLDIEMMYKKFPNKIQELNPLVDSNSVDKIVDVLSDNFDIISKHYNSNKELYLKYLKNIVSDKRRVAVIDVGWKGSGPLGIKDLIENEMKLDCKVDCIMAGRRNRTVHYATKIDSDNDLISYLFSPRENYYNSKFHRTVHKNTASIFFELFTQDTIPSFDSIYEENGEVKFKFSTSEFENHNTIREIQDGIYDFSMLYSNTFKEFPFMLDISGFDAYLPFKEFVKNRKYMQSILGSLTYSRGISEDDSVSEKITISDILNKLFK